MMNHKEVMKKSAPNLLFMVAIYIVIMISPWKGLGPLLIIVFTPLIIYDIYKNIKNKENCFTKMHYWKGLASGVMMLVLIYYLYTWLGGYGLWGVLAVIVLYVSYRIYKDVKLGKDSNYMEGMRDIETRIWGSPLDERKKNENKK